MNVRDFTVAALALFFFPSSAANTAPAKSRLLIVIKTIVFLIESPFLSPNIFFTRFIACFICFSIILFVFCLLLVSDGSGAGPDDLHLNQFNHLVVVHLVVSAVLEKKPHIPPLGIDIVGMHGCRVRAVVGGNIG